MNKILIVTVGGSHQPVVRSLNDNKPDFTLFLCSDDTLTQKGSYTQITDRVSVKKECEMSYLPNIPSQTNLKEGSWEITKIKYLVKYLIILEAIKTEIEKGNINYLLVEDIVLNAERRAAQGRYEDAVGRIYRATEMIAQIRLRTGYHQDTGNILIENLAGLNEDCKNKLAAKKINGKIQTGLRQSYELLAGLNDHVFKPWYEKNENKVIDFLQYRNNSLFAHGFKAVDQNTYDSKIVPVISLIRELVHKVCKDEKSKRMELDQFPRDFIQGKHTGLPLQD